MYARYAFTALGTLLLCVAGALFITLPADPYKLYPQFSRFGPDRSVDLFFHLRLLKPYILERMQPEHIIVGSSRSARLSPQELEKLGGSAYNASLPGTDLSEVQRVIEHTHATGKLSTVILGLDYLFFVETRELSAEYFVDARWLRSPPSTLDRLTHLYQKFEDLIRSLLSVDSLVDSWQVLSQDADSQRSSQRAYSEDGTWHFTRLGLTPNGRYGFMARQVFESVTTNGNRPGLDELARTLDFAADNGIRLMVLISPRQALQMQTLYLAEEWDNYLQWHRDLVSLVEQHDADAAIYGIENNALLVLEPVDARDPLFRDGIHYRREPGRGIVACMLGSCDSPFQPTRLDHGSIEDYLAQVDTLRRRYLEEHPADVIALSRWLKLTGEGD